MTFDELYKKLRDLYANGQRAAAKIVFSNETDCWDRHDYTERERTYVFSNEEKYFRPDCIGSSLFAYFPAEHGLTRLDWYLDSWKVESCRITRVYAASFVSKLPA